MPRHEFADLRRVMNAMPMRPPARPPEFPAGFANFYAAHYDFVWRCARRLGAGAVGIEDVVQDCFVIALRRFDDFDPDYPALATTWLFAILRNVLHTRLRSEGRRRTRLERFGLRQPQAASSERTTEALLAARVVDDFLGTLSAEKRAMFILVDIEGMTGADAARSLELNPNTASARLRAARKAFATHCDGVSPELGQLQRERAPEEARHRGLALLALASAPVPQTGTGTATAIATSTSAGSLGSLGSSALLSLILTALTAGSLAVIASELAPATRTPPMRAIGTKPSIPQPSRSKPIPLAPAAALQPAPAPVANSPSRAAVAAPAPPTSLPPDPANAGQDELEQLAQARRAMIAGEPARALAVLEGQRFTSSFEARRLALEIGALCALERETEAQQRAQAWRSHHPRAPLAPDSSALCWTE